MRKKTSLDLLIAVLCLSFTGIPVVPGLLVPLQELSALEESLTFRLGGESSPGQYLMTMERDSRQSTTTLRDHQGLKLVKGFKGAPELRLADAQYGAAKDTEFLYHFNDPADLASEFSRGSYRLTGRYLPEVGAVARFGGGAAVFSGDRRGIELLVQDGSLFEPDTFWGDFTLEFWLHTGVNSEGEELFGWDGYTRQTGKDIAQYVSVYLSDGKLNWEFGNFFVSMDPRQGGLLTRLVKLSSRRSLVGHTWQHHMLRFNARRGLLEYLLDGRTEALVYVTDTGHEETQQYQAYVGERSSRKIFIGRRFTGLLDEMRLSRSWVRQAQLESHYPEPGWLLFNPVNFRDIGVGSKILSFDCEYRAPGTSELQFFYKMADQSGLIRPDDPAWIRFRPGVPVTENNQGQFLFIKVEFLPDGNGLESPSFQALTIRYKPDPPPPPPGGLVAIPGDGSITLRWNPVPGTDIRGYLVHYGTKPGVYHGEGAVVAGIKAPSPVNAGNVQEIKLEGLQNGQIYYFRVATYDVSTHPDFGMHVQRGFSKEVSARPAR